MRNQLTEFADAINGAACKIFTDYGSAVDALTTVALVAPPVRPVAVALSLGQWAAERNCTWDQDQAPPDQPVGCYKENQGNRDLFVYTNNAPQGVQQGQAIRILSESIDANGIFARAQIIDNNGSESTAVHRSSAEITWARWCFKGPDTPDPGEDPPAPTPPPYTHVTEEGCSLTVNFKAWGQMPDGTAGPIFLIEPSDETRASGGIIGGCNFNPTIVYSPSGGGGGGQPPDPIPVPYPPDPPGPDGKPIWQKLLEAALAGAVSGLVQNLFDQTDAKLDALLECACPEEPVIQGQFRTISFRSDETSPFGKSRLRKRLRYRGSEGVELSALVDHWRDFSWQSGSVRVRHTGASWGTPEVWAATEDEGKRVILHAAREAGIDPNQVGRWSARGSDSSRLGVSDTMRVDTTGGYYWITARDGSDQRPIVAVPRSDN